MIKHTKLFFFILLIFLLTACELNQSTNEHYIPHNEPTNHQLKQKEKIEKDIKELPETMLQKGNKGKDVQALQHALITLGYPIDDTKLFDELTTWAITDFQLNENIMATGFYDQETREYLERCLKDGCSIEPGRKLSKPKTSQPNNIVENPYDVLALVNKERELPHDYEPKDLTIPDVRFPFEEDHPKKQLRKIAADALEALFEAADQEGIHLFAQSGYRSYDRQEAIFASNVNEHGEDYANRFSARPGQSEHQTGLVMDVTSKNVGFQLIEQFGDTPEGKWLKDNAHKYGFIIRYPKGKEDITGYVYEPWHIRYLGVDMATAVYESGLTYEEYLEKIGIVYTDESE